MTLWLHFRLENEQFRQAACSTHAGDISSNFFFVTSLSLTFVLLQRCFYDSLLLYS